jgi:hypothetical protein
MSSTNYIEKVLDSFKFDLKLAEMLGSKFFDLPKRI